MFAGKRQAICLKLRLDSFGVWPHIIIKTFSETSRRITSCVKISVGTTAAMPFQEQQEDSLYLVEQCRMRMEMFPSKI